MVGCAVTLDTSFAQFRNREYRTVNKVTLLNSIYIIPSRTNVNKRLVWFPPTLLCNIGSGIVHHLGYCTLSTVDLLLSPKTCFASKDYCHSKIFLSLIHNI